MADACKGESATYFVEPHPISPHLHCPSCKEVFRNPTRTPCSHVFCNPCIRHWVGQNKSCPTCRSKIDISQLSNDLLVANLLADLPVRCSSEGCSWTGPFQNLTAHVENCEYTPLPCRFRCGASFAQRSLGQHEIECIHRPTTCECSTEVPLCLLQSHKETECPHTQIDCPNHCGVQLARLEIPRHVEDSCPNTTIACGVEDEISGECCDRMVPRRDLDDHRSHFCEFRRVSCTHHPCQEKLPHRRLEKHLESCGHKEEPCQHCGVSFPRMLHGFHLDVCELLVIPCEYAHCGCPFKAPRREMALHMSTSSDAHVSQSRAALNQSRATELYYQQRIQNLEGELKDLRATLESWINPPEDSDDSDSAESLLADASRRDSFRFGTDGFTFPFARRLNQRPQRAPPVCQPLPAAAYPNPLLSVASSLFHSRTIPSASPAPRSLDPHDKPSSMASDTSHQSQSPLAATAAAIAVADEDEEHIPYDQLPFSCPFVEAKRGLYRGYEYLRGGFKRDRPAMG